MSRKQDARFSDEVGKRISTEEATRDLWKPIAEEFDRDGPDAAREFLVSEKQRLEESVQRLLREFGEE